MAAEKKLIDSYTIFADKVPAVVSIWNKADEVVPLYEITIPVVGKATMAILESISDELATKVPVDTDDVIDTKKAEELKQRFYDQIKIAITNKTGLGDAQASIFSGIMLHKMYGMGDMDLIMADDNLEEIAINGSKEPISVYHKKHGWCKTTKFMADEAEIYNLASQIGRKVGNDINTLNPIMDSHLLSGDRVASSLFPISTMGNTMTIRKFARNPWTAIHFIDPAVNTLSKEIAAFVWLAMQYELNILVAGGTASGKTSMLNSLCTFIPPMQRVISIEDTREIYLPKELHWNWVPMSSRLANPEGQGQVTMLDLMVASLRMRPDRIVVGEVRRREQAEAMFEAMHTGHSVYATMHADNVEQVKRRLIEPPIAIPKAEIEALHLILIQYRDRRRSLRRTLELAEVMIGREEDLTLNYLFRWQPRTDAFVKVNESIRVQEELNLHTGMTPREITEDLKQKQDILDWMLKNSVKDVNDVGKIMRYYYKERDTLLDAVFKNKKPEGLLKMSPVKAAPEKPPLMILPLSIGMIFARPLRPICYKLRKSFPDMSKELDAAELPIEDHVYIALSVVNIAFFFGLFFGLVFVLMYRVQEKTMMEALGQAFASGGGIALLIAYALFTYPKIMAGKKAEEVNRSLVFALRDLLMQVTSGVPLYRGLVNVAGAGYGQVSTEFERVAKQINTNTPIEEAFRKMATHTRSDYLKRVTWQLMNTIKAGSSLKAALRIIVNDLTLDQRTKIRDYAHELNLWSLIYMIFAVAVPTIGIVMMVLLSSFMGMGLGKSAFVMFIIVCLAIQFAVISLIKSRRPMVDF